MAARREPPVGEANGRAKLSDSLVVALRDFYRAGDVSIRELGRCAGLHHTTVWRALHGFTWGHVGGCL